MPNDAVSNDNNDMDHRLRKVRGEAAAETGDPLTNISEVASEDCGGNATVLAISAASPVARPLQAFPLEIALLCFQFMALETLLRGVEDR